MPTVEHMQAMVNRYLQALNQSDLEAVVALYATDATVEDPVGSVPLVGIDAIRAFYAGAVAMQLELVLEGEIRIVGNEAAFPFSVSFVHEGRRTTIRPIDLMRFNEAGQIVSMRAYFGASNIRVA